MHHHDLQWLWLDDLRYLLVRVLLPVILIPVGIFAPISPDARVSAATIGGALIEIEDPRKRNRHDSDSTP